VTSLPRRAPLLVGTSLAVWLNAAPASAADDWWGEDKLLHFGVSMLLASGGYAASSFVLEEPWQRALAGGALSLSLGIAKESFDLAGHGDPSWKDLTWDGAGTLVGVGFCFSLDAAFLTPAPQATRR
jgi:putative lipoprotein